MKLPVFAPARIVAMSLRLGGLGILAAVSGAALGRVEAQEPAAVTPLPVSVFASDGTTIVVERHVPQLDESATVEELLELKAQVEALIARKAPGRTLPPVAPQEVIPIPALVEEPPPSRPRRVEPPRETTPAATEATDARPAPRPRPTPPRVRNPFAPGARPARVAAPPAPGRVEPGSPAASTTVESPAVAPPPRVVPAPAAVVPAPAAVVAVGDAELRVKRVAAVIPVGTPLNTLTQRKARVEAQLKQRKADRQKAYDRYFLGQTKLSKDGANVQAKEREVAQASAALASAELAADQASILRQTSLKRAAEAELARLQQVFRQTVSSLETQANAMGEMLLNELYDEALLRTLDERIYIMERRKLAAGATR